MTNAQMLCPLRWDPPYARRYTTHANKYFFGKNMVVIATRSISPSTPLSAPDLWYTVQGTGDVLTATLGNGPVGFFSRITVWKGSSCGAMTCVGGCNSDCGTFTGETEWNAMYYIRIDGTKDQGKFQLTV